MVNPVTGDQLWFVRLPTSPDDELAFECAPRSPGTPLHVHTRTAERFECVEGVLSMIAGPSAAPLMLRPGEGVDVPVNVPHRFWNDTDEPVRFRSTATPGIEFEQFLRSVCALAIAGRVGRAGMPRSPLQLPVLRELSDLYFVGPPILLQRAAFAALSGLATLTGSRRRLTALVNRSPVGKRNPA
jgi:mannose-6-phosphate isomerase-like protein (cupin superfamily)